MSAHKPQHFLPKKKRFSPLTPTTPTLNNSPLHKLYCIYLTVQTLISNPTLFIYTTELAASADLPSSSVRALFPYLLYTCYGRYSIRKLAPQILNAKTSAPRCRIAPPQGKESCVGDALLKYAPQAECFGRQMPLQRAQDLTYSRPLESGAVFRECP